MAFVESSSGSAHTGVEYKATHNYKGGDAKTSRRIVFVPAIFADTRTTWRQWPNYDERLDHMVYRALGDFARTRLYDHLTASERDLGYPELYSHSERGRDTSHSSSAATNPEPNAKVKETIERTPSAPNEQEAAKPVHPSESTVTELGVTNTSSKRLIHRRRVTSDDAQSRSSENSSKGIYYTTQASATRNTHGETLTEAGNYESSPFPAKSQLIDCENIMEFGVNDWADRFVQCLYGSTWLGMVSPWTCKPPPGFKGVQSSNKGCPMQHSRHLLIIISHSTGGIVTKAAFSAPLHGAKLYEKCISVSFFSTPHIGSEYFSRAHYASAIGRSLGLRHEMPQILRGQFQLGSPLLEKIGWEFAKSAYAMKIHVFTERATRLTVPMSDEPSSSFMDENHHKIFVRLIGDGLNEFYRPFMPLFRHENYYAYTDHARSTSFEGNALERDYFIRKLQGTTKYYMSANIDDLKSLRDEIKRKLLISAYWSIPSTNANDATTWRLDRAWASLDGFEESLKGLSDTLTRRPWISTYSNCLLEDEVLSPKDSRFSTDCEHSFSLDWNVSSRKAHPMQPTAEIDEHFAHDSNANKSASRSVLWIHFPFHLSYWVNFLLAGIASGVTKKLISYELGQLQLMASRSPI